MKVNGYRVKPNKIKDIHEMLEILEKLGDKARDAWLYVSPGVIEMLSAEAGDISSRKGIYRYIFGTQSISLNLGIGRIPTIKRWNLITEICSKKIKFKTVCEDCEYVYFFEAR
jgi:hypothetical protein